MSMSKHQYLFCFICLSFFLTGAARLAFASAADAPARMKEMSAEEYRLKGYEAEQSQNWEEAIKNYSKAISLGVKDPKAYNDLGVLCERMNFLKKAEDYYLAAIEADANYLPAHTNIAFLYKTMGNKEKAIEFFKKRYELAPSEDSWAVKVKTELLTLEPSLQDWIYQVEANRLVAEMRRLQDEKIPAEYQGLKPQQLYDMGVQFNLNQQYDKAVKVFDVAILLDPLNPIYAAVRRDSYAKWQELIIAPGLSPKIEKLTAETNTILIRQTDNHVVNAIEQYLKAKDLLAKGDLSAARAALDQSLLLVPGNPPVMEERKTVELKMAQKDVQSATTQAEKQISEGNYDAARAQMQQVLKAIPEKNSVTVGKAKEMLPEWNQADYAEFENRIKFNHQHFERGQQLMEEGSYQKAYEQFAWAVKLIPSDKKSAELGTQAQKKLASQTLQTHSDEVVRQLESGNSDAAKQELEKFLSTLPEAKEQKKP